MNSDTDVGRNHTAFIAHHELLSYLTKTNYECGVVVTPLNTDE